VQNVGKINTLFIIIIYFAQINWTRRRTHDQHENKSRTRKAQKTGAYILPIKKEKNKHTRYKNNYDYAYRKNAEKSTRLSDRLNLDNNEKSLICMYTNFQMFNMTYKQWWTKVNYKLVTTSLTNYFLVRPQV